MTLTTLVNAGSGTAGDSGVPGHAGRAFRLDAARACAVLRGLFSATADSPASEQGRPVTVEGN